MTRHLIKHKEFTTTFTSEDNSHKTYGVYFNTFSKNFYGLMRFVYRKRVNEVSVYFHFLDRNGQYIKMSSMSIYNQVFRSIFLNPDAHKNSVKLLSNIENGSICFQICYYSNIRSSLLSDMDQGLIFKSRNFIVDLFHNFIEPYIPIF